VKSVPIITKVVSSNPTHGEVYSIQRYLIKFVIDLWQVNVFPQSTPVSSPNKADLYDITEILLKVASNTITLTLLLDLFWFKLLWFIRIYKHFSF
jgi:hypothetical protein